MSMIYLDYAATTPVDTRVVQRMLPFLTNEFGNPASRSHERGWRAAEAVSGAREQVASLIDAKPSEIIWTSGATEAINLGIKGIFNSPAHRGNHLITLSTEHKAVLDTAKALERQGVSVTILDPDRDGLLNIDRLREAIRPDTTLVSVLWVNNEIGVVQDVPGIAEACHNLGVLLHVDAAQTTGKVPINVEQAGIDLMSMCAHKTYGPKGIGALYVRAEHISALEPLIHGGGHERGIRSGTLPTHQIVGMGEAFQLACAELTEGEEINRVAALADDLLDGLLRLEGVYVNGSQKHRVPHILNVGFEGVDAESLMPTVPGLALSTGSACSSGITGTSHVLRALGLSAELADGCVRISMGRFTKADEVAYAVERLCWAVRKLRAAVAVIEPAERIPVRPGGPCAR